MSFLEDGQEILDGKFRVVRKSGGGSFGQLFKIRDQKGRMFALKVEKAFAKKNYIQWESKFLNKLQNKTYVPEVYHVSDMKVKGKLYRIMVMDLLGKSLEDLQKQREYELEGGT